MKGWNKIEDWPLYNPVPKGAEFFKVIPTKSLLHVLFRGKDNGKSYIQKELYFYFK